MTDQTVEPIVEPTIEEVPVESGQAAPNGKPSRWLWIGAGLTASLAAARAVTRRTGVIPALRDSAAIERILIERHGSEQAAKLLAETQRIYHELVQAETKPAHRALQMHLYHNILTGLALYRAQLEAGIAVTHAQETIAAWIEVLVQRLRRQVVGLDRLPGGFTLLRAITPLVMRQSYPPAGWTMENMRSSSSEVSFDVTSCYYLDTLTRLGAPELTPLFCAGDDLVYGGLSKITWGRSKTLARGGDCCDFHWCLGTAEEKEHPAAEAALPEAAPIEETPEA